MILVRESHEKPEFWSREGAARKAGKRQSGGENRAGQDSGEIG